MPQETEPLATDQTTQQTTGKGRALLHVPSRTSSQRHQSSPTASGLSGATANDSRQSLGDLSKESASMRSRQRNGSASSRRSGADTEPASTPINSQPSSPAAAPHKKKKSGGLLSLLGCCGGVPDSTNNGEGSEENVHKLDKLPNRPGSSSRPTAHTPPDQQPTVNVNKSRLNEKAPATTDAPRKDSAAKDKRASNTSTHDQSTVGGERPERESKQSIIPPPSVQIQPPNNGSIKEAPVAPDSTVPSDTKDEEGDIKMADADIEEPQPQHQEQHDDQLPQQEQQQQQQQQRQQEEEEIRQEPNTDEPVSQIPPPPPGPSPSTTAPVHDLSESSDFAPEHQQISLLPPIRPEHKGRKCLVLDLDETLVHSSFKVCQRLSRFSWS